MSSRDYIKLHRKHNMNVSLEECEQCVITTTEVNKQGNSRIPSETPQGAHTRLPEITPLGTLIYDRDGWEPPLCPPGYHPRSSDPNSKDAWILEPVEPVCKHLELKFGSKGGCGCHRIIRKCKLIGSFVGVKTCGDCLRRDEDAR